MVRPTKTLYPYVCSTGKVKDFFVAILTRPVPPEVNTQYLLQNKFNIPAEYDNMLRLLHELKLIDKNNKPTKLYTKYHDSTNRNEILGKLVKNRYRNLFNQHPQAWNLPRFRLKNFFETAHISDPIADVTVNCMVATFRKLVSMSIFPDEEPEVVQILQSIQDIPESVVIGTDEVVNLSIDQEEQILQAVSCLKIEAYRASIVLTWTAVADYLRRYLETDSYQQLRDMGRVDHGSRNRDWSSVADYNDLEGYADYYLIDVLGKSYNERTSNSIKSTIDALHSLRIRRNRSAHPSDREPSRPSAVSFILECLEAILDLTPAKVRQFS